MPALMLVHPNLGGLASSPPRLTGMGMFFAAIAVSAVGEVAFMSRRWFSVRLDSEGLSLVGPLRLWRRTFRWADLAAAGPVTVDDVPDEPVLAVRPNVPPAKRPAWALGWRAEERLLLIAKLNAEWSAPVDVMLAAGARFAGSRWVDPLGQVPTLRRRRSAAAGTSAREVFRPRWTSTLVALLFVPAFASFLVALAVIMFREEFDLIGPLVMLVFAGLLYFLAGAVALSWTAIEVDAEGLSLARLFGTRRRTFRWRDLDAVGTVRITGGGTDPGRNAMEHKLQRMPILALRPHQPPLTTKRLLGWDPERQLMLVVGLDNWSAPRADIVAAITRFAGARWAGELAELPHLPR